MWFKHSFVLENKNKKNSNCYPTVIDNNLAKITLAIINKKSKV